MEKIINFNTKEEECYFCGKKGTITEIDLLNHMSGYHYAAPACDDCLKKLKQEFANLTV